MVRHSNLLNKNIKKVAVCGGAGSYLLEDAIKNKADIFISSDFKYHEFFRADNKTIIADIGHYESEQFSTEILYDILTKKFTTFAFQKTSINTNPIKYL
jgi:putative NIF3 family GTP cyclohydrolase 1 type 2